MEKEGLRRCVIALQEQDIEIAVIVTDRHVQINKWIKDNMEDTDHRYDVWHMAKCKFECSTCFPNYPTHFITRIRNS